MAAVYLDTIQKVEACLGMVNLENFRGIVKDQEDDELSFNFYISGHTCVCSIWGTERKVKCVPEMPIEDAVQYMLRLSLKLDLPPFSLNLRSRTPKDKVLVKVKSWCVTISRAGGRPDEFFTITLTPDYATLSTTYYTSCAHRGKHFYHGLGFKEGSFNGNHQPSYDFFEFLKLLEMNDYAFE